MKKSLAIIISLSSILCIQIALYTKSSIKFDNHIIYSEKLENKDNSDMVVIAKDKTTVKDSTTEDNLDSTTEVIPKQPTKKENQTIASEKETINSSQQEEVKEKEQPKNEITKQETSKKENEKLTDKEIIALKNDKLGTIGRLYLPSVNFNVAVYEACAYKGEEYNAQQIVDAKDSAAHFYLGEKSIIADHNYQGFKNIMNLKKGDKAYIKKNDGEIAIYELTDSFIGENTGTDIINSEGISITTTEQDLVMYTCYDDDGAITITCWNEIIE